MNLLPETIPPGVEIHRLSLTGEQIAALRSYAEARGVSTHHLPSPPERPVVETENRIARRVLARKHRSMLDTMHDEAVRRWMLATHEVVFATRKQDK